MSDTNMAPTTNASSITTTAPAPQPEATTIRIENESSEDLVQYREGVEKLYELGSDRVISNSQPDHAAILFSVFFKHAEHHVRIFCHKLSNKVFGNQSVVQEALKALKRKDFKLTVIIQEEQPEAGAFQKVLASPNATLLVAPDDLKKESFNFAVMDKKAFRLEPDRENNDHVAQAVMHDPVRASSFAAVFDRFALRSRVVSAPTETPA